jgi:hypothetical protein
LSLMTEQEIAFFRVTGYVIKRGAVEPELIAQCRDRIWDSIPENRDAPETWQPGKHFSSYALEEKQNWANTGPFPTLAKHESLDGIARQLLGDNLTPPEPGSVLLKFPVPGDEYAPPTTGHLDNTCGHSLNTITILDEILPRGGGFTVWPGSHMMCHEYFRHHDVREPLNGGQLPWRYGTGVEFTGAPGDVCYIHPWMIHTVGHNVRDTLRMVAQIGFFRRTLKEDYDHIPDDLWWFWEGMQRIESTMRAEDREWHIERGEDSMPNGLTY